MTLARGAAGSCLLAALLRAQHGDVPGEVQQELPPGLAIPPALVRSAAEELATFRLQPGFRAELIASEPLIGDPVAAVQAPDGRLWVVEMRSYMRDVDASGERTPDGRIVVLTDRDGDGRMDEALVFADGLLLPRAVLPLHDGRRFLGALVIAPPQLLWLEDRDGDGRADHGTVIIGGFEAGLLNPEHAGNGLLWALDNRIHLADDKRMLRWTAHGFEVEDGAGGGQWGIAQDDRGRLFFDYNEDWLRCDLVPGRCRAAAPWLPSFAGCNHRVVTDTSVWPIRVTPGVNRGYQPGVLKDGVLVRHTAACAPHVARGDRLGDGYGDVFVCEPAANLVRRFRLAQQDGLVAGSNVYDRAEFLASTDERFRPVNLFATADGALGLVDMYRGVIQHRNYVTSFLRKQILGRELERPTGLGRIWRLCAADPLAPAGARPLQSLGTAELVQALGERDGWRRDTAQRLLVLRQDGGAVPLLRQLVRAAPFAPARCGAAAALEGLGALDTNDLRVLLRHDEPSVLAFALQRCGDLLAAGDRALWARLEVLLDHPAPTVRWHAALALAEVHGAHAARAVAAWARLGAAADPADAVLRDALCAAAVRREAACVRALAAGGAGERAAPLFAAVARAAGCDREAPEDVLFDLLDVAAACMLSWQQRALLQGLLDALPPEGPRRQGWYTFAVTPPSLAAMARTGEPEVVARVRQLLAVIALRPAASLAPAGDADADLLPEARALVAAGGRVFASVCAACHQLDGRGMAGLAPPLRDSEWVTGEPSRLIRIALHGLRGPVRAAGSAFDGEMPGQSWLGDQDLAAALSFLRRAFGHRESAIDAAAVAAVRAQHAARAEPWTAAALAPGH